MKKILSFVLGCLLILTVVLPITTVTFAAGNVLFTVKVNSSENEINLRSGNSKSSGVITMIHNGTTLDIYDMKYNSGDNLFFGYTVYNGTYGWISLRQTDILNMASSLKFSVNSSAGSMNFRSSPSTGSGLIGEIPNGTVLDVTQLNYNASDDLFFGYTFYNGSNGWISLRQCDIIYDNAAMYSPTSTVSNPSVKTISFGEDLTDDQEAFILNFFGADRGSARIIYVNNQQEHEYLGSWIPEEQIGNKTISCAYVQPTQSGGIQVKTANLTYVTGNMIASLLSTAGVTDCNIIAAAPFPVSGTGALTGILLAYQDASGEQLEQGKLSLAIKEYITLQDLDGAVGEDKALQIINAMKQEIIKNGVDPANKSQIEGIVNQTLSGLTEEERAGISDTLYQTLVDLLSEIARQNYNYEDVAETLNRVEGNLSVQTNMELFSEDAAADTNSVSGPSADIIFVNTNDEMIDPALISDTGVNDLIVSSENEFAAQPHGNEAENVLTEQDIINLCDFLVANSGQQYDYRYPTSKILHRHLALRQVAWYDGFYPGEDMASIDRDPLNKWEYAYKISISNVNWVMEHIFHLSPDLINSYWNEDGMLLVEDFGEYGYIDGGYFYRAADDAELCRYINIRDLKYDGDKYYVIYSLDYYPPGFEHPSPRDYYAVLGYEIIDGAYYWTMYYVGGQESGVPEGLWNYDAGTILTNIVGEYDRTREKSPRVAETYDQPLSSGGWAMAYQNLIPFASEFSIEWDSRPLSVYVILDINNDGIPELMYLSDNSDSNPAYTGVTNLSVPVYTYINGAAVNTGSIDLGLYGASGLTQALFLMDDNRLCATQDYVAEYPLKKIYDYYLLDANGNLNWLSQDIVKYQRQSDSNYDIYDLYLNDSYVSTINFSDPNGALTVDQIAGFSDHVTAEVLSPGGAVDSQGTYQYLINMGIPYLGISAQEALAYLSEAARQ